MSYFFIFMIWVILQALYSNLYKISNINLTHYTTILRDMQYFTSLVSAYG